MNDQEQPKTKPYHYGVNRKAIHILVAKDKLRTVTRGGERRLVPVQLARPRAWRSHPGLRAWPHRYAGPGRVLGRGWLSAGWARRVRDQGGGVLRTREEGMTIIEQCRDALVAVIEDVHDLDMATSNGKGRNVAAFELVFAALERCNLALNQCDGCMRGVPRKRNEAGWYHEEPKKPRSKTSQARIFGCDRHLYVRP